MPNLTALTASIFAFLGTRLKGLIASRAPKYEKTKNSRRRWFRMIKLARQRKFNYARIASYFQINQGRIADVMKGRRLPNIPAATSLPTDFPSA